MFLPSQDHSEEIDCEIKKHKVTLCSWKKLQTGEKLVIIVSMFSSPIRATISAFSACYTGHSRCLHQLFYHVILSFLFPFYHVGTSISCYPRFWTEALVPLMAKYCFIKLQSGNVDGPSGLSHRYSGTGCSPLFSQVQEIQNHTKLKCK